MIQDRTSAQPWRVGDVLLMFAFIVTESAKVMALSQGVTFAFELKPQHWSWVFYLTTSSIL